MTQKISVLIIEDSALMRRELTKIIQSDPVCRVVGSAVDGEQGLRLIQQLNPDVVTLDINLPGMDGLTCLQHIMLRFPRPCLIISAHAGNDSVETFEALELGAIDFVQKPSGEISRDIEQMAFEICRKVKTTATANLDTIQRQTAGVSTKKALPIPFAGDIPAAVVVIGVSTGGPRTLMQIIPLLPEKPGVPIIIVQHMPPKFTTSFAVRLNQHSRVPVKEAQFNEFILNNMVYVVPGDSNLMFKKEVNTICCNLTAPDKGQINVPSVEKTLESAIDVFGSKTIGVILTGMGNDGGNAMQTLFDMGGETIAESEETAVIFGMPKEVIDRGAAKKIVPCHRIHEAIMDSIKKVVNQ